VVTGYGSALCGSSSGEAEVNGSVREPSTHGAPPAPAQAKITLLPYQLGICERVNASWAGNFSFIFID